MYVESLVVASSLIMNTKTLEQVLTDIICYSCHKLCSASTFSFTFHIVCCECTEYISVIISHGHWDTTTE